MAAYARCEFFYNRRWLGRLPTGKGIGSWIRPFDRRMNDSTRFGGGLQNVQRLLDYAGLKGSIMRLSESLGKWKFNSKGAWNADLGSPVRHLGYENC